MNAEISRFIAHARSKGMDHATIRVLLLSAGWKEKDVAQALTAETLDLPVPMPPESGGARDAFFHLLAFASLVTTFVSLIILFFTYINRLFPDAALQNPAYLPNDADFSTIRWSMAAVIVGYPLFFFVTRFLIGEMQRHREKAVSGVRRWLTYLTLFVTALALMGDFITLLFTFLQGELSIRFILKVFVIFALAGMTFLYYFLSIRQIPSSASSS
ncbi:hypothetical protein HY285_05365 [Candidatus Peregrinibacteria bacterium]|nr:hypothetical protein [Candidatus Peregrinibacteria bacterium]MBI3816939.1 hypothetical protein [Candidatus Peregrinibacteria bacterium]